MKTVKKEVVNEIVINKSRFITIIMPIFNTDLVPDKLSDIRKRYKGATHYCFGYVIGPYSKAFDDGEPSGTAGLPILEVLKNNDLVDILCVVVRYFGGIKLGAGGLIRAYSSSTSLALSLCEYGCCIDGYEVCIEFDYSVSKKIDYILKDISVSKKYGELISYTFDISDDSILESLKVYSNIVYIKSKKIIKDD